MWLDDDDDAFYASSLYESSQNLLRTLNAIDKQLDSIHKMCYSLFIYALTSAFCMYHIIASGRCQHTCSAARLQAWEAALPNTSLARC